MNLSIYIKLQIANARGKVKIDPTYKHLEYIRDKHYLSPIYDGYIEVTGWPLPSHSDWYAITSEGKAAMWNENKHLVTRFIAWLALAISFISFLLNYLK